jgi:hypothetical protein
VRAQQASAARGAGTLAGGFGFFGIHPVDGPVFGGSVVDGGRFESLAPIDVSSCLNAVRKEAAASCGGQLKVMGSLRLAICIAVSVLNPDLEIEASLLLGLDLFRLVAGQRGMRISCCIRMRQIDCRSLHEPGGKEWDSNRFIKVIPQTQEVSLGLCKNIAHVTQPTLLPFSPKLQPMVRSWLRSGTSRSRSAGQFREGVPGFLTFSPSTVSSVPLSSISAAAAVMNTLLCPSALS